MLPTNETSQNSGRNASTVFRLVRGTLDETPRLRSDSHEARSTRHLDYRQSPTRTTPGQNTRPILSTYSETKDRVFNMTTYYLLPSWLQPQPMWKQCRCQVSLFTTHPRMGGENLSLYTPYRTLFCHRSPSREDTTRSVPHDLGIRPYPPVLDPASTQPRPITGQQGGKADVAQDSGSFHRLIPYITMVSKDALPFLGHVATTTSTGIDKTSPQGTPVS
jgi:hypothetical protein